jgi:hypothetical protein
MSFGITTDSPELSTLAGIAASCSPWGESVVALRNVRLGLRTPTFWISGEKFGYRKETGREVAPAARERQGGQRQLDPLRQAVPSRARFAGGNVYKPSSFGIGADPGHQEQRRSSTKVPTEASGWRSMVRRSIARLVPRLYPETLSRPSRVSKSSAVSKRQHILTRGRFGVGRS